MRPPIHCAIETIAQLAGPLVPRLVRPVRGRLECWFMARQGRCTGLNAGACGAIVPVNSPPKKALC
jgi:hypothetical protein